MKSNKVDKIFPVILRQNSCRLCKVHSFAGPSLPGYGNSLNNWFSYKRVL